MNFDNYILLKEDYKTQLQSFKTQGVAEDIALTYLNTHKIVKQLFGKSLTPQQNNIDSFKKFDDLKNFIHTLRHDTPNFDNKIAKESINLAQTRFKGQSINKQPASPKLIQDTINAFIGTVASFPQSFPFPKNNINSYKSIEEVKTTLDNFKAPENQTPTQEDESPSFFPNEDEDFDVVPEKAKTIYDDNQLAIYLGLSPDACISIKGKHPTNWCVARSDASQNAYYGYRTNKDEPTFYFVKNKKKIEEEGPNPIHTKYKDPSHFLAIQVTKDNKYLKTDANNIGDKNVTWEEIVETEPLLADKKELFKWHPLTPNEELAKSMKKGVDAETFKNYSIKKKIMYVQTGKLGPAIWNLLNDDLTLLAINRFKVTEPFQIASLRDKPKLYKRWLDTNMERQGVMFVGQDDYIPISVYQEINDNFSSSTIQNFIKQYNIDLKKVASLNRKVNDDIWNTFNDEEKLNIALRIKLTPKQLDYIKSNDKLFEKFIILAIEKSKKDPEFYSFVSDNIVKDMFKGNLEETEKLIQEKYRNIVAKLTTAFLDPFNMSKIDYGKIQGSVLDSLAILFNFIRTHNNFAQGGYIKQGNIFEKELPKDQQTLANMLFDYFNFHRGLGRRREDWYKQYTQYLREFCNDIHASATIIIKYCDSVGTIFKKNLQKLLNLCSNYKPKTYEPFQEPDKTGNRLSNESTMSFKLWLEKLELISQKPVPDEYWTKADGVYARIYGNQHKNPQWLKSFQKENTASTYTMPIEEESFIHFAPNEVIEKINQEKQLKTKSNYAVSTTFGFWFPQVQYSHISRMLPDAIYSSTMKELKKLKKPIPPNKRIPDYGNEISAIRFKTNTIPNSATPEEVWWDKPVEIFDTEILSSREAINILKNTPEYENMSPGRNIIKYI